MPTTINSTAKYWYCTCTPIIKFRDEVLVLLFQYNITKNIRDEVLVLLYSSNTQKNSSTKYLYSKKNLNQQSTMYLYTNDDKGGNDDNQPNWVKKLTMGIGSIFRLDLLHKSCSEFTMHYAQKNSGIIVAVVKIVS